MTFHSAQKALNMSSFNNVVMYRGMIGSDGDEI